MMTPTVCDNCGQDTARERGAVLAAIDYPGGDYALCKRCLGPDGVPKNREPGSRPVSDLTVEVLQYIARIRRPDGGRIPPEGTDLR